MIVTECSSAGGKGGKCGSRGIGGDGGLKSSFILLNISF
jgi:hypothetical protein